MKHLIASGAVMALIATTAVPAPVAALDLGKTVRDVTRSVSRTVDSVTGNDSSGGSSGGSSTASDSSGGSTSGGTGTSGGATAGASASAGKGGVKARVGSGLLGGTTVELSLLGTDAAAEANASVGNGRVGAAVLSKRQLATLRIDSNPPGTGNVAVPGSGGGSAVVGVTQDYVRKLMASLNRGEEQMMMKRCAMILRSPKAFDAELVLLCRLAAML